MDANGDLKTFEQFRKDTEPIIGEYNRNWLRTEYDTAVIRARMAARFKEFQRDADLFPNLKWTESTSVVKRELHKDLYGLILPINHPFWTQQYPGSLWNCKCGITNTDDPENSAIYHLDKYDIPTPPAGLEGNPAVTGKIYSNNNAYEQNPYPGAEQAVNRLMALPEMVAETFKMKLWIEKVLAESKARNATKVVGGLSKKAERFLKAKKIIVKSSDLIITDKQLLHLKRSVKKHPLDLMDIAKIEGYLNQARIYYDLSHNNLIYFIDKGDGVWIKFVVQPDYLIKTEGERKLVNLILTANYTNANDLQKSEYIKIRD